MGSLQKLPGAESPESRFLKKKKKKTFPTPHHITACLPPRISQLRHLFCRHICEVCSLCFLYFLPFSNHHMAGTLLPFMSCLLSNKMRALTSCTKLTGYFRHLVKYYLLDYLVAVAFKPSESYRICCVM